MFLDTRDILISCTLRTLFPSRFSLHNDRRLYNLSLLFLFSASKDTLSHAYTYMPPLVQRALSPAFPSIELFLIEMSLWDRFFDNGAEGLDQSRLR